MPTLGALATHIGGSVVGDADVEISDVADLQSAGPEHLSFLSNPKYEAAFRQTKAGGVLADRAYEDAPCPLIVCDNPYLALAKIATFLHPGPSFDAGIEAGAHVHASAKLDPAATVRVGAVVDADAQIGARSVIGAGCYVGHGARIGEGCFLHPGSRVLDGCVLGDRVILQAGAVIGSDGFGYAPDAQGKRRKIPQVGIVEIGDDVEIGANVTVDRATFGVTRIGKGSKIDNLVQIAHNVVLGEDCVVVSQSGIAGSTHLGNRVVMGAQTGIAGHITIADDVMLGARAGVAGAIKEPGVFSGVPAIPHKKWLKTVVALPTVPEMRGRMRELEKRLAELEKKQG